jgi:hypothetical protein
MNNMLTTPIMEYPVLQVRFKMELLFIILVHTMVSYMRIVEAHIIKVIQIALQYQ